MPSATLIAIENLSRASLVCSRARLADSFFPRLRGLLGRPELSPDSGILLIPSTGIHTFGMTRPIDVVALDRDLRILAISHCVPPWRIRTGRPGQHSVLELKAGQARRCALAVGDRIAIHPITSQAA